MKINSRKFKRTNNGGITLITLIVTIIILIILAAITIYTTFGEQGIVERAKQAKQEQLNAQTGEYIKLDILDKIVEYATDNNVEAEPFYFEIIPENEDFVIKQNNATLNLTIKNNNNQEYNVKDTTYQISIENNDSFQFSVNNEQAVNNSVTKTLGSNSLINDELTIKFSIKDDAILSLNEEDLILKVKAIEPYVKEYKMSIKILTKEYGISTILKESFREGTIAQLKSKFRFTSAFGNSKHAYIDDENGLYINDDDRTVGYWVNYYLVAEDGYSTALDTSHIYYTRIENKAITNSVGLMLADFFHPNSSVNGVGCNYITNSNITLEDYKVLSIWGVPKKSGTSGDYPDSIQFGSSATSTYEGYIKNLIFIDLSDVFGKDNEPSNIWLDNNIKFDDERIIWFDNTNEEG